MTTNYRAGRGKIPAVERRKTDSVSTQAQNSGQSNLLIEVAHQKRAWPQPQVSMNLSKAPTPLWRKTTWFG